MKSVIYETKGRAREFCELAINLYQGCGHACIYCYGADVTHTDKKVFDKEPRVRVTPDEIENSAKYWAKSGAKGRPVLLCFVTDPYQPLEKNEGITRVAISTLNDYGFPVHILTKAGELAQRDFDLLVRNPENAFATTLTITTDKWEESRRWEPNAATPAQRIQNLETAYAAGIKTWVSLEPVIYPEAVFRLIRLTSPFVGHFKVGTMNYHPHGQTIDWKKFGNEAISVLEGVGANYYIKKALAKHIGRNEGFWRNG